MSLSTEQNSDNLTTIFGFKGGAEFSESEANQMVDLLMTITKKSRNTVNGLNSRLKSQTTPELTNKVQEEINSEIQKWSDKVTKLGLIPLSLWQVTFPADRGQDFNWKFPMDHVERVKSH